MIRVNHVLGILGSLESIEILPGELCVACAHADLDMILITVLYLKEVVTVIMIVASSHIYGRDNRSEGREIIASESRVRIVRALRNQLHKFWRRDTIEA